MLPPLPRPIPLLRLALHLHPTLPLCNLPLQVRLAAMEHIAAFAVNPTSAQQHCAVLAQGMGALPGWSEKNFQVRTSTCVPASVTSLFHQHFPVLTFEVVICTARYHVTQGSWHRLMWPQPCCPLAPLLQVMAKQFEVVRTVATLCPAFSKHDAYVGICGKPSWPPGPGICIINC